MLAFEHGTPFSIEITSRSHAATPVSIRGLTREGVFTFSHTPLATSAAKTESFRVPDIPIMISVIDPSGAAVQGSCFVQLKLKANDDVLLEFCSGYVYGTKSLSWPAGNSSDIVPQHGRFESDVSPSNPAAGANFSYTVPTGEIWRVFGMTFRLTTDANVANRRVFPYFSCASGTYRFWANEDQAASLTHDYVGHVGESPPTTLYTTYHHLPMPRDVWIRGNGTIGIIVDNKQAGDQLFGIKFMQERFFVT